MSDQKVSKEEMSADELDQIIQDMSKDDAAEEKPTLELVQSAKKKPAPAPAAAIVGGNTQQLTMEMNGVVNLKLCFKNGERSVEVLCTEDFLTCRMADGTEFKIPTGAGKVRKAA